MNTQKPIKVLMLASSYPRSQEDSASIFLRHLAEHLSKRGLKVHVLAPADREAGTRTEGDIRVHRFQYLPMRLQKLAYGSGILPNLERNPWLWLEVPFFIAMMTCFLLRLVRKEKPDLIHAHWVVPQGLAATLARIIYKLPLITTAHGADAFGLRGRLTRGLKHFVLRHSDAWTSNTRATSNAFGHTGGLPEPHIIPMGVDVERFQRGNRDKMRGALPPGELLILFVGRLVEKKGIEDLLTALSLLQPDSSCRTSLWIVGEGDCRHRLEQQAQHLGLGEKARFWGAVSNDLLPDFYAAADLFVAPSVEAASGDTEGLGVVLLEAFASRVCVLATRVGGISEVVEDGNTGVLVEPRDPLELAAAIEKLLAGEILRARLAENAFAKAKESYSLEKIAQDFEGLYRDILSRSSYPPSSLPL